MSPRDHVSIRQMTRSDLPAVEVIQQGSGESARWNPSDYLEQQSWVAESAGRVVGFLVVRKTAPDEAEVLNLAVAPAERRRGVARVLLQALPAAPVKVFLEVRESNTIAQRLYASSGFRLIGRRPEYYHDPAEDAIVMLLQKC